MKEKVGMESGVWFLGSRRQAEDLGVEEVPQAKTRTECMPVTTALVSQRQLWTKASSVWSAPLQQSHTRLTMVHSELPAPGRSWEDVCLTSPFLLHTSSSQQIPELEKAGVPGHLSSQSIHWLHSQATSSHRSPRACPPGASTL